MLYNECIRCASKDFNAKYSLVKLLTFVLFQNRLLLNNGSARLRIKEEGMCVNSCLIAPLRSYKARLFIQITVVFAANRPRNPLE